jgi:hypothetical protein
MEDTFSDEQDADSVSELIEAMRLKVSVMLATCMETLVYITRCVHNWQ